MPPDLFAIDESPTPTNNVALFTQQPSLFESDLISTAWTVENESSSPSESVDIHIDNGTSPEAQDESQQEEQITSYSRDDVGDVTQQAVLDLSAFPSTPKEVYHLPTALSEYFFREVITLYCLWDSKSNVMRNIVETMWQSSGALHHTIQSMAAACLCEDFPHLRSVARSEHTKALELIHKHSSVSTYRNAMLLAATLLGHTSSWLNPQNLATDMFRASCSMLNDITTESPSSEEKSLSFFSGTMDYWAMLLVYLTDSNQLGNYRRQSNVGGPAPPKTSEPHPYSGISHEMVRTLTDIGILVFQYRKHMTNVKFMTETDFDVFKSALREARKIERILLAHRPPQLSQFKDPGDPKTPLKHLELIDEAYRCTGLLQLYRVFPDLLNERYAPWDEEHLLRPLPSEMPPTKHERQTWLTHLAMHILGILKEIPFESRTRSAQPFLMVALSSELRMDPQTILLSTAGNHEDGSMVPMDKLSIEVARARKFIGSRLAAYTHILPLRKSQVIFELINHVWKVMDAGQQDVYWLDVAYEKKLGTMMG